MEILNLETRYPEKFNRNIKFSIIEKAIKQPKDLTEDENSYVSELIRSKVKFEGEKFNQEELKEIKNYIFFMSLAKIERFDMPVWEKSLSLLPSVKRIFIFATSASKGKIVDILFPKNIKVEIVEIDDGDYEGVYKKLKKLIFDNELERDETVIDNTLGFKMTSAVFYRFSIEQNIKLISWQTQQIEMNNFFVRIPGTDTLHYLKSPSLKNYRFLLNMNNLIKNYRFKEASFLCYSISNDDRGLLLEKLSEFFNLETFKSEDIFYDELERFEKFCSPNIFKDSEIKKMCTTLIGKFNDMKNMKSVEKKSRYCTYVFSYVLNYIDTPEYSRLILEKIFENSNHFKKQEFKICLDDIMDILKKSHSEDSYLSQGEIEDILREKGNLEFDITTKELEEERNYLINNREQIEMLHKFGKNQDEKLSPRELSPKEAYKREEIVAERRLNLSMKKMELADLISILQFDYEKPIVFDSETGILKFILLEKNIDFNLDRELKKFVSPEKSDASGLFHSLISDGEYRIENEDFKELCFLSSDGNKLPNISRKFMQLEEKFEALNKKLKEKFKEQEINCREEFIILKKPENKKEKMEDNCSIYISEEYL